MLYFSVSQQKEVAGVWYRNQEGKQFLKIALPADAWSMTATVKTKQGVHKISLDRWGDSTHKLSAYNNRHKPSFRDERQIERMDTEAMLLHPVAMPNPVLPKRVPGFSGGRGVFPRGDGGIQSLNWRAEGLKDPTPGICPHCRTPGCAQHMAAAFYQRQREAKPYVSRKKFSRKSPSRRPHRKVPYYPPSPQYMPVTSSEDEGEKAPAAKGKYTDPTPTPIPRDEPAIMDQDGAEKEDSPGYSTPPEGLDMTRQQRHTALSNKLDKALEEVLGEPAPRASSLRKQGGGDREATPGPQDLHQGKLNLTTERWWLEPNKVRYMEEPDTYRANVGRHREHPPRLMRAKTYPHLVFVDPPASPDKGESSSPREERSASTPPRAISKATPDSSTDQGEPSLEMPEAPPVPLEPKVVVVPYPGAPTPAEKDSDCEIVETPENAPFKPKKGWAKKRMEQTKKTLVLCIPRLEGPATKKEEAGAAQMENPPAPQAGEDPGAGEEQEPQPDSGNGSLDEME